jgi:hypothetical protein
MEVSIGPPDDELNTHCPAAILITVLGYLEATPFTPDLQDTSLRPATISHGSIVVVPSCMD